MDFETYWSSYPKKQAKATAKKAWEKINPSVELACIIVAAVQHHTKHNKSWIDGFVPMPSTYLNQQRWEDEIEVKISPPHTLGSPQTKELSEERKMYLKDLEQRASVSLETFLLEVQARPERYKPWMEGLGRFMPEPMKSHVLEAMGEKKAHEENNCPW